VYLWEGIGEDNPNELDIVDDLGDIIVSVLSFLVFASAISWVSEKFKQIFRPN
jgi:hypothetical protein